MSGLQRMDREAVPQVAQPIGSWIPANGAADDALDAVRWPFARPSIATEAAGAGDALASEPPGQHPDSSAS